MSVSDVRLISVSLFVGLGLAFLCTKGTVLAATCFAPACLICVYPSIRAIRHILEKTRAAKCKPQ